MCQNWKAQSLTNLKSSNCDKTYKTQITNKQNSTQIVTKLKTQIVTKLKTHIVTKLNSNCDNLNSNKTKNPNSNKTQKLKLWLNPKTEIVKKNSKTSKTSILTIQTPTKHKSFLFVLPPDTLTTYDLYSEQRFAILRCLL